MPGPDGPIFYVCMAVLVLVVLAQTSSMILKCLEGKVTRASTIEYAEKLKLPAVTVCPGFKEDVVRAADWLDASMDGECMARKCNSVEFPASREEQEGVWANATFALGEVLSSA